MKYTLLNKEEAIRNFSHFVYIDEDGRFYVADHSIRDLNDPSSTDDGLLCVDFNHPPYVSNRTGMVSVTVTQNGLRKCNTVVSLKTAEYLGMFDCSTLSIAD